MNSGTKEDKPGYDIISIGELLIDFTPEGEGHDGYPVLAAHPGGSVANFLAAASARGMRTALCGRVGDDAFGRMLIRTLEEHGIDPSNMILTPEAFTTLAFVTWDENGDRDFSFARKPGADILFSRDDFDMSLLGRTKMLHFSTVCMTDEPARDAHKYIIEKAREKGVAVSFGPNYREPLWRSPEEAKEQMLWGLAHSDIIKISDSEVEFLFGTDAGDGAELIFAEYGPDVVFVTCGADGCVYKNANAMNRIPAPVKVVPVDTTGAGDIFGGTAAAEILKLGKAPCELSGEELDAVVTAACTEASLSTERLGGMSVRPENR